MADNDNTITVVGRIGQEPELRATDRGDRLTFTLATSDRRRAADGTWFDGPTSWFRVVAWNELGRHAHASFHRGQQVIVRGVLTVKEFRPESGGTTRTAELRATALGHDLRWGTTTFTDGGRASSQRPRQDAVEAAPAPASAHEREPGDWGAPGGEVAAAPREPVPVGAVGNWPAGEDAPF